MNLFIGLATLMTLLVVAWLVYPLLRTSTQKSVSAEVLNIAIHRDQLAALEADLQRGAINPQDFETTRDELQLRLLDDTQSHDSTPQTVKPPFLTAKTSAWAVGIVTPLLAVAMYWHLGTPQAIEQVNTRNMSAPQVEDLVHKLAARLQNEPDNHKGWAMLARSYKVIGRLDEAQRAFEKTGDLLRSEPDTMVEYADLLAVRADSNLEGRPLALINQALALDPTHPVGLMLSGVAAFKRSEFPLAIAQWEKLLTLLEPGSADAQQVETDIAEAKTRAGLTPSSIQESGILPPVPAGAAAGITPEMINQMVDRLATRLKDTPDDVVGWSKLARAYKVQGRLDEAINAYQKTGDLLNTDPDVITQYADVLVTRAQGNFSGQPRELIYKALAVQPKHPIALMLAGAAAYQAKDDAQAITHWETVLTVLPVASKEAQQVQSSITQAKARQKSAMP